MPFELKWIHLIGPLLATVAMFFVGDNFVRQERGKDIRIVPTILMFGVALGFHFIFSEGNFLDPSWTTMICIQHRFLVTGNLQAA